MKQLVTSRKKLLLFLFVCVIFTVLLYTYSIISIPEEITLTEGDANAFDMAKPWLTEMTLDRPNVIFLEKANKKADLYTDTGLPYSFWKNPWRLRPQQNGSVHVNFSLLGLLKLKTLRVDVIPYKEIAACGGTVGVKLDIAGILVIGVSDVVTLSGKKTLPAADSGIQPGDLINQANGRKLTCIDDLIAEVEKSNGKRMRIGYQSNGFARQAEVIPEKAADDQKYHLGLWVRDNTVGIGTLTFFDPDTQQFGALGHGITDIDTGTLMPVAGGEILESSILGVKRGSSGHPGELKGVFIEDRNQLGQIQKNSEFGIYGLLNPNAAERIPHRRVPVGLRSQVKEGPATILANIDGKNIEEFAIEIQKISRQSLNGTKGMIVRITDPKLLELTGGIVQGMSGSPILQNQRMIGAITHVLVNDPTKGYGIFIEGMLKNILYTNNSLLKEIG